MALLQLLYRIVHGFGEYLVVEWDVALGVVHTAQDGRDVVVIVPSPVDGDEEVVDALSALFV